MNVNKSKKALLVLDFINDIVHPDGQYASHGYVKESDRRGVLNNAARAIKSARQAGVPVIYVTVGFSDDYLEWPSSSSVFNEAKVGRRILLGSWATQVHDLLAPLPSEHVLVKHRVSPFYQTSLELLLRQYGVDTLLLTGVSTEFVILSTVYEAHDRDYSVVVLQDATTSSNDEFHESALKLISRIGRLSNVDAELPCFDENSENSP